MSKPKKQYTKTALASKVIRMQGWLKDTEKLLGRTYGSTASGEAELLKTLKLGFEQLEAQMKAKGYWEVPKL